MQSNALYTLIANFANFIVNLFKEKIIENKAHPRMDVNDFFAF